MTRSVFDGPYGRAYLRPNRSGDILLVAGGSGLSPMVSIALAAATDPILADRQIRFFYGGREPRDLCAEALLAELPGFGRRLIHVAAVSEPSPGWTGPRGLIHEVVRACLGEHLRGFQAYFAGPPPMVRAMQLVLQGAGVGPDRLHFDEFF